MTDVQVTNKKELLAEMDRSWNALLSTLDTLTTKEMTIPTDEQGWTIKDHLYHLIAWESSAISFLQRHPRHEALGVEETLYLNGTEDENNASIQRQHQQVTLDKILAQLHSTQQELMRLLATLTDPDLYKPYHDYLPNEPRGDDGRLALHVVYGNSAHHFDEHLPWIKALIGDNSK